MLTGNGARVKLIWMRASDSAEAGCRASGWVSQTELAGLQAVS